MIINNKKYNLNEFINKIEIKSEKIKINIILIKELSHFSYMFQNCIKLKEIFFYNNIINTEKEELQELEDNNDSNTEYYEDNNDDYNNNFST